MRFAFGLHNTLIRCGHGFHVLVVAPEDARWTEKVRAALVSL